MAAGSDADQWVLRVLGLDLNAGGGSAQQAAGGADPQEIWNECKAQVDTQIELLAKRLRSFGDTQLDRIADKGLFGVMKGGEIVGMMGALLAYRQTVPPQEKSINTLKAAVANCRKALTGNKQIRMLDENPLGVPVAMAATLEGALQRIEQSLH